MRGGRGAAFLPTLMPFDKVNIDTSTVSAVDSRLQISFEMLPLDPSRYTENDTKSPDLRQELRVPRPQPYRTAPRGVPRCCNVANG